MKPVATTAATVAVSQVSARWLRMNSYQAWSIGWKTGSPGVATMMAMMMAMLSSELPQSASVLCE